MDCALFWFRRDLRLTDHAALHRALSAARRVYCVFVFDPDILAALPDRGDRRVSFIHASVAALHEALLRQGGGLIVRHGRPRNVIPELAASLQAEAVFATRDYEPFARERDAAVAAALGEAGRHLLLVKDQVIFDTDDILTNAGRPYHVFTPYKRAWLARLSEREVAACDLLAGKLAAPPAHASLPTLADLGFQPGSLRVSPGEAGARTLFEDFQGRIDHYAQTRDFPGVKGPSYLSVHLRFGTISVRELVRFAWRHGGAGGETWLSELIWREFYQMLLWHYPQTVDHAFQSKFAALPWPNPPGHLEAWQEARTGYPIVDAAMRQLEQTGYMHNRLRMIAASFLCKDLHVDWRPGERHFAAKLLDYDQAANIGGWQWSASLGTDAQPWFRIFNPVTQSQKFDPHGRFIRRYLPELAQVPDKYLHAPWQMPAAVQSGCGVMIGRDYPPPIVDHATARQTTLELFRTGDANHHENS